MQKRSTADYAMLTMGVAIYLFIPTYAYWHCVLAVLAHRDTPAWVQAFGSVLAVLVVLVLWRFDRTRAAREAQQFAVAFMRSLVGTHDVLIQAARNRDGENIAVAARLLDEAYSVGKEVPLQLLSPPAVSMMIRLRARLIALSVYVDQCERTTPHPYEDLLKEADDSARFLIANMESAGIRVQRRSS